MFKYIFGAISTLAVAVVANENSADLSLPKEISFEVVIRDTDKFKNNLIAASKKESVTEVVNNLNDIYKPVSDVCHKFHLAHKLDKTLVGKEAEFFFKFLKSFEEILQAILQHSKVFDASHGIVTRFNEDFNLVIGDYKKYQIDLKHAYTGISFNVSIWVRFGLGFINSI